MSDPTSLPTCQTCSDMSPPPHPLFTLCGAKRFDEALQLCKNEIATYPGDPAGYRHMADVLELMKHYNEAIPFRNRVIELVPDFAANYFSRADLFYQMKNYAAAIKDFSQAAELDHDNAFRPLIFLYRADCYRQLKAYDAAIDDCMRVPDDFDFPGFLGQRAGGKRHLLAAITRDRNAD